MSDATSTVSSIDPSRVVLEVLSDRAAVLFGLEPEFGIVSVTRTGLSAVEVIVERTAREGPCPACGVLSARVKDRPLLRVKDLPASGQRVELWWRKRRLLCVEALCPRRSFTQTASAIRPRGRVTERLRDEVANAIAGSNRAVADVAREYGVSWPTAHKALVAAAAKAADQARLGCWVPRDRPGAREPAGDAHPTRHVLGPLRGAEPSSWRPEAGRSPRCPSHAGVDHAPERRSSGRCRGAAGSHARGPPIDVRPADRTGSTDRRERARSGSCEILVKLAAVKIDRTCL